MKLNFEVGKGLRFYVLKRGRKKHRPTSGSPSSLAANSIKYAPEYNLSDGIEHFKVLN